MNHHGKANKSRKVPKVFKDEDSTDPTETILNFILLYLVILRARKSVCERMCVRLSVCARMCVCMVQYGLQTCMTPHIQ